MATSQASSRLADEVDPIETGESGPRTPGKPAKADPIKFGAHIKLSQFLNFSIFVVAFQALVAALIGLKTTFGLSTYTQMAVHTAFIFVILSVTHSLMNSRVGVFGVLSSRGLSGTLARRMMLAVILIPPLTNWLSLEAEKSGILTADAAILLRVTGTAIFLVALVWKTVSELEASDSKLKATENKFQLILASVDSVIWAVDQNGVFIFSEGQGLGRLGLRSGERVGQSIYGVHPPGSPVAEGVKRALGGETSSCVARVGNYWFEVQFSPSRDTLGKVNGVVGVSVDVTARMNSDLKLQQLERRLKGVINHAPMVLWAVDPKGIFSLSDGKGLEALGFRSNEVVGKSLYDISKNSKVLLESFEKAVAGFGPQAFTHEVAGKVLDVSLTPVLDPEGNVVEVVGMSLDVTARHSAEQERMKQEQLRLERDRARASTDAKSEFLATMSHEIRTPINGIMGMSWLLMESELNPEQKSFAETIISSSEGLLRIINDVLDFSKIESGKMEIEKAGFALGKAVEDVLRPLEIAAKSKGLKFILKMGAGTSGSFLGDEGRLKQILLNLVGNSLKFTSEGEIEVEVLNQGNETRFQVRDTGIGIADSARNRIFESFSQADSSTTRKFGGTGLGLSICKKLIQLMEGTLSLESKLGSGSTFTFTIPLPSVNFSVEPSKLRRMPAAGSLGLRILVVEDNKVNQRVIEKVTEHLGYHAVLAGNGIEGLEALRKEKFDLILMDCQMPEMDGFEATRQIRAGAIPGVERIPIVALTSNVGEAAMKACTDAGMDAYLTKPFNVERLAEVVEAAVEKSKKAAA